MPAKRCCWQSLFLVLVLVAPALAVGDTLAWETDLEGAKRTAARTNRLVLVHFGATWCQPCQQLEREVFSQPGFGKELRTQFVCVKLDYDANQVLARQYGVQSIPTDVILAADGRILERVQSPRSATEYTAAMTRIASMSQNAAVAGSAAQPGAAAPAAMQVASAPSDGRYADYYNRRQAANAAPPAAPYAGPANPGSVPAAPAQAAGPALQGTYSAAPASFEPGAGQFASQAPSNPTVNEVLAQQPATPTQIPPGNAPLGLDSYCPVSLYEKHVWIKGDPRWGMQHRGQTYLFASAEEQQRFRDNPDKYSPVLSGNDPVLAIDQGQAVPGKRMYGLFCGGHVYLFTSEQTLQQFQGNLSRYTAQALEARRAQP